MRLRLKQRTSVLPWADAERTWRARHLRLYSSTTISVLSSSPYGSAAASTITSARRWDSSSLCTCPSQDWRCCRCCLGLPILFGPVHIAFLEMVIDPVCSLVFEAETEEEDVMRRRPRAPDEPLFSAPLIAWGLLQGAFAFALVAAIFVVAFKREMPEEEVRALAFFSLVLAIVGLIFVNRSFSASLATALRRPNPVLSLVLLAVTTILSVTLLWPFARGLFRFGPLHLDDLALTLGAGVLVLVFLELLKPLWRAQLQS